ncbi:unnamed protein product, partial [Allacma fusca]
PTVFKSCVDRRQHNAVTDFSSFNQTSSVRQAVDIKITAVVCVTMEERLIICCGASGWTKVIGWLEMIGHLLMIIVLSVTLAYVPTITKDDWNKIFDQTLTDEEINAIKLVLTVFFAVSLVVLLIGMVMTYILLRGAYLRNTTHLRAWIIYAVICFFIAVFSALASALAIGSRPGFQVPLPILHLIIRGFFIWVVSTHVKEIEAESKHICTCLLQVDHDIMSSNTFNDTVLINYFFIDM